MLPDWGSASAALMVLQDRLDQCAFKDSLFHVGLLAYRCHRTVSLICKAPCCAGHFPDCDLQKKRRGDIASGTNRRFSTRSRPDRSVFWFLIQPVESIRVVKEDISCSRLRLGGHEVALLDVIDKDLHGKP